MKYPAVIIYLGKDISGNEVHALKSVKWCDVNMRRWIYAADIFMFGEYLTPKILFKPPFKIVQAETTCLACGAITPIVAVEASGYVPTGGEGCDLALNIAYWLEGGADELKEKPVYLAFVQEYPPEFLKLIRRHSFLFRKYSFGEENDYLPMPARTANHRLMISSCFMSRMVSLPDAIRTLRGMKQQWHSISRLWWNASLHENRLLGDVFFQQSKR